MKNKKTNMVAGIFMVLFIGAFLIVTGRFLYIQASGEVANVSLADWAKEKRTSTYFLNSERGKIFDKNGMTLAYNRLTYRLYAIIDEKYTVNKKDPKHVDDPQKTAELLRSEEHTSELQSRGHLVCRLLLEKKKKNKARTTDNT